MTHFLTSSFVKFVFADSQRSRLLFPVGDYVPAEFTRLLAALDCKPHLNIGYLSLRDVGVLVCIPLIGNPGINDAYTTTTTFCLS